MRPSAIKYKPAPGRDESIVVNECGFATVETAFGGLSGFHVRLVRRFGPTTSITDHVWPWPVHLLGVLRNGLDVFEEGTVIQDIGPVGLTALGYTLDQFNETFIQAQPNYPCYICKLSMSSRVQASHRTGVSKSGIKALPYIVGDYYYYCEKEACFVAVRNRIKEYAEQDRAWAASQGEPVMSTQSCYNPACGVFEINKRAFKSCAACLSVKYCSVSCQRAAWDTHKVRCRAINAARKTAKAEKKAREGAA